MFQRQSSPSNWKKGLGPRLTTDLDDNNQSPIYRTFIIENKLLNAQTFQIKIKFLLIL